MKVMLINHTNDALNLLLFTKNTRLQHNAEKVEDWTSEKKMSELEYMLGTIRSSWEFVDYVFHIEGVSRAFTHQLVRTRSGSYAQQSQRTVDMQGFDYIDTTGGDPNFVGAMIDIQYHYRKMIERGVLPQDARGILPTNIATSIIAKFNLRTLSEMARVRLCTRTQGEYQEVFRAMRNEVLLVHPWADPFIRVACAADGVCQFPNYHECPIKPGIFNPDTGGRHDELLDVKPLTRREIHEIWKETKYEAVPISR